MSQSGDQVKRRWEKYSIELRRGEHNRAFDNQRKRTPSTLQAQEPSQSKEPSQAESAMQLQDPSAMQMQPSLGAPSEPGVLQSFQQLKAQLEWANSAASARATLLAIKNLLTSSTDPSALPVDAFDKAGLFDAELLYARIDSLADDASAELLVLALWILSNYFASTCCTVAFLREKGLVGLAQRLLLLDRPEVTENALFCLCNVVGDCLELREDLASHDVYALTFEAMDRYRSRSKLMEVSAWLISNSLRPPAFRLEEALLDRAADLLRSCFNLEVVKEALWAISFYIDRKDGAQEHISRVTALRLGRTFNRYLARRDRACARPLLRVYGYLSYGDDAVIAEFYDEQFVRDLLFFADSPSRELQQDALWVYGNLVGTSKALQDSLFREEYLETIFHVCETAKHVGCRAEALRSLANYASFASPEQLLCLTQRFGAADLLLALLEESSERPLSFYLACLRCVEGMLTASRRVGSDAFSLAVCASPHFSNLQSLCAARALELAGLAQQIFSENFEGAA